MVRYSAGTSGAAPLQIQLGTGAVHPAYVVGFSAMGENSAGAASRPVLTRPSTLGTGTPNFGERYNSSSPGSHSGVLTAFASAPSIPTVGIGTFNLPLRVRWAVASADALVVPINAGVLLYANAAGGHTWSGEIIWEER